MITALDLISDTLPALKPKDAVGQALEWLDDFKVTQLPIAKKGKFLGIVNENQLLDAGDIEMKIEEVVDLEGDTPYSAGRNFYVKETTHLYDVLSLMSQFQLEIVGVVDAEKTYLGVVTLRDVLKHLSAIFSIQEEGTILVLSVLHNNYSVSEIGRIAESANARILSLYVNEIPDSNRLMVTIKVNVINPERVIAAFERFSYEILMSYFRADKIEDYKRNLDMLFWMIGD